MPSFRICDRCDQEIGNLSYTSWYNSQQICPKCRENEQRRPDYPECRKQELEAIERGDRKFEFLPAWKE